MTYGETLATRQLDYVEAARALGAGSNRIITGTVLPNITGPIIVQFSLTIASAILIESGLSFLGLGVVPPEPSLGLMIRSARGYMNYDAMGLVWPCLGLILIVLIFNALCDGLCDVFDPKARALEAPPVTLATGEATIEGKALVQADNLSTHILTERGDLKAVDGISFAIEPGETLAVVGESGSGKSMTGLSIMGLVPEPAGRIAGGSIRLRSQWHGVVDVAQASDDTLESVRGSEIAMIFQEPMTALNPVYRIGDQIVEAILCHREVSRAEAHRIAVDMLTRVGIPDADKRIRAYPHELSGGMRQRAMIAMALVLDPALIIADEPTTALDVTIQAQILELLKQLQAESDPPLALLFVTHNLGVVAEIADRVMVIYAGQCVEEGPVAEVFGQPRHPYTRGLLDSVPVPGDKTRLKAIEGVVPSPFDRTNGCAFAPRCPLVQAQCQSARPGAGRDRTGAARTMLLLAGGRMSEALLEVEHLTKHFDERSGLLGLGSRTIRAVDDVTFGIRKGEVLGLVGESGSGKSTLGRTVLRLIDPTSGRIRLEGDDITEIQGADLQRLRRRMQIVFQDPYSSLDPRKRVRDIVGDALAIHRLPGGRERVLELLEQVGLSAEHLDRYPHEFSGGQRQRIGIARALAVGP